MGRLKETSRLQLREDVGHRIENTTLSRSSEGALRNYMMRIVGSERLRDLIRYELITALCGGMPGAAGLVLRQKVYPFLIGDYGRKAVISREVVIRCPRRLFLGPGVLIDERVFFDIKSCKATVRLGARSQIMHGAHFETGYAGSISIGEDSFVGTYSILNGQGGLDIGRNVLIAGHCHIVAGNHDYSDPSTPISRQGFISKGIKISQNAWLGAGVKVLDGVHIGEGSIVAAGAVVTHDVEPFSIVGGIPAKKIGQRETAP